MCRGFVGANPTQSIFGAVMKATRRDAEKLLLGGMKSFARLSSNGIKVDTEYLEKAIQKTDREIRKRKRELGKDEIGKVWQQTFGEQTNFTSRKQLGTVLFDKMGLADKSSRTATGVYSTDEAALEKLKIPFVEQYLYLEKLNKARGTYLGGIQKYTIDGIIYPSFMLDTVITFRSSSKNPNFQNIPVRNPKIGELIRRCFIGRGRLVEIDYGGIEVCVSTCYNKDKNLISYVKDKTKDMHRDMAAQCYMIPPDEVDKMTRYCAKNMFVFPQFYGSYYLQCCQHLWNGISQHQLKTKSGVPIKEVLRKKGIRKLGACKEREDPKPGTFEHHIKEVEKDFWENRFSEYTRWKKRFYSEYLKNGYFDTLTGFHMKGLFLRNQVLNVPVQGSAFHCLLFALTLLQQEIDRRGMKTLLVGQIHDSIVADVPDDELQEYLSLAQEVMIEWVPERWKWIIVPLEVEAEVTPVGGSWWEKREWKQSPNGLWEQVA